MINSHKELDCVIYDMLAHNKCSGVITEYRDSKRLLFGWKCSCGKSWVLPLFPVKRFMDMSIFKENIRTSESRKRLIWSKDGCPVLRNEELETSQDK